MLPAVSQIIGAALRTGVSKTATPDSRKEGRAIVRDVNKKAGAAAAAKTSKAIRDEAAKKKLSGQDRKDYIRENQHRVSTARRDAKSNQGDMSSGASLTGVSIPSSLVASISRHMATGDIEGAGNAVISYTRNSIRRGKSDMTSGKMFGDIGVGVSEAGTTIKDVSSTLSSVLSGESFHNAGRNAAAKAYATLTVGNTYTKGGPQKLAGETAAEVAGLIKTANKLRADVRELTSQPASRIRAIMDAEFGPAIRAGVWADDRGREWTPFDVEALAGSDSSNYATARDINPGSSNEDSIRRQATTTPVARIASGSNDLADNLNKSFITAGMKDNSPRMYNDIMSVINTMSPNRLAWLVGQAPTVRGTRLFSGKPRVREIVSYLSSDVYTIRTSADGLLKDLGLDPDDYDFHERAMMPDLGPQGTVVVP